MNDNKLTGYAVASIACGIGSWFVLGIILAPLGVVFAIIGMKSQDSSTRTMATLGMVISVAALSLLAFAMIILASAR